MLSFPTKIKGAQNNGWDLSLCFPNCSIIVDLKFSDTVISGCSFIFLNKLMTSSWAERVSTYQFETKIDFDPDIKKLLAP